MSVIAKQSVLNSIVKYVGVLLGTINVLFIYTLCFSEEQIGQLRYIQETAILLTTFFSLGVGNLTVRYFPAFRSDDKKHNGFLGLLVFVNFVGLLLFLGFLLFSDLLQSVSFSENKWAIAVILACIMFINLFTAYASNFQKIVVPELFNNLLIKIGLPVLALLLYGGYLGYDSVIVGLQIVYMIALVGMVFYLAYLGLFNLQWSSIVKPRASWKEMRTYMIFGLLGGVGSVFASRIDIIMITEFTDYANSGVYTIALFIASVVGLPMNSVRAITGPIISQKIKDKKIEDVDSIYKKSSINLFMLGALFFILIMVNLSDVFAIMPNGEKYAWGASVVLIIGIAKLFDLLTSVNGEIILYSKYYKYTTYFILIMSVINISANLILIPKYSIAGAAAATLISLVVYNVIKLLFIKNKMGIQPFSINTFKLVLISMAVFVVMYFVPMPDNAFVSIVLRSIGVVVLFALAIYRFKISEEALDLWQKISQKIKR